LPKKKKKQKKKEKKREKMGDAPEHIAFKPGLK
jgi:hypothetical protein